MKTLTLDTKMSLTIYVDKKSWDIPFVVLTHCGIGDVIHYGTSIEFDDGKEVFEALKEAAIDLKVLMIVAQPTIDKYPSLSGGLLQLGFVRATKNDDYAFAPFGTSGKWTHDIHTMMYITKDTVMSL